VDQWVTKFFFFSLIMKMAIFSIVTFSSMGLSPLLGKMLDLVGYRPFFGISIFFFYFFIFFEKLKFFFA
jgi:hypothetical protein